METKHRARKRFGQNFLHDQGIIRRIVSAIYPREGQRLLEIGPGQGAITELLLESGCELSVIELDRDLVPILEEKFSHLSHFHLYQGDALKFDIQALAGKDRLRVVGNLPYNISTPLIFHLLSQQGGIADMHFMLQKEVVERLAAETGSKAYGRLGIMAQYYCQVENLFEVPPECFSPRPKVQSAIVRLTPHTELPHPANSVDTLQQVLRSAFNQRRKTLRNNLKELISSEALEDLGIDPGLRPEKLALAEFVTIANHLTAGQ
ncbi:16S rRNA (adenine(1518)-N(6)/adenine(1519)-N(6))-dimethyltransferase RsmA [Spongiibacter taiwanensis]|uniref:16S rRNA (adenine(1518)-N(6)/adenine(1519)-N(6))- dimethyltransferase RsmA n=1 Tax=Spongiibacter taiwanensis TaxID=1748242 RepID=UPI0020351CC1|nr:16S rRNA (adenine(1518)-N(6)/adenine(1519)-N(6))-dimethyltransferase RsmA [Spongiibacter taiwanensis]USA43899.1 16S rRNA (adenine(1518)-N(6)/adenine(1519)-N(6))-dimethyltransferase RsmA [Spongiibacter taiwanensis]